MTNDELKEIIEKHEKWLEDQDGGERAVLRNAVLYGANLHNADLCGAILYGADLRDANLRGADLRGVDLGDAILYGASLSRADLRNSNLYGANLYDADLHDANLRGAFLDGANLRYSNLCGANLCGANLCHANLCGANLCGANLGGANLGDAILRGANLRDAKNVPFVPMVCPDSGAFTAWKKANGHIVKLLIPEDARRSSAAGRKCRCDKAIVIAIETVDGEPAELDEIASDYDGTFVYKVGETVTEPNFCEDRFQECAEGIHFFINRQEAVNYN